MAIFDSLSNPGGAAQDLFGQVKDETDEEKKRRLAAQRAAGGLLDRFSPAGTPALGAATALGLSMGF